MLPENFYDEVEKIGYLNNVLYSDTDSLFLVIPIKNSEQLSISEKLKISEDVSKDINSAITKYLNEYLLPKSNISQDQNMTFFKSEMLIDSIMFLDVKKNYAYKILAKKGKIFKTPRTEYVGIQAIKSDAAKITQDLLKQLIENIILNNEVLPKNRMSKITEIVNKFYEEFNRKCEEFDFIDIGFPGKWHKKDMFINGMILYNHIFDTETFSMGSAGIFIYCNFKDPKLFKIDISKTKGICVPYSYNKELIRNKFNQFKISIDKEVQWNKLFTTTIQRIISLIEGG